MEVSVNEEKKTLPSNTSLAEAIEAFYLKETNGIAVAINERVIKRENWTTEMLRPNDKILIIRAAQGG
tara:strand:- start:116 stop:319 length:204 start_codon:yes stop_codon:yes gene_type:complete